MNKYSVVYALAAATVLLLPAARHSNTPPPVGTPRNSDRVTLQSTPPVPSGWKRLELKDARASTVLTQLAPDKELPLEFANTPSLPRPIGGDLSYTPPPDPVQQSSRRQGGRSSRDKENSMAAESPGGLRPLETAGWLAEGIRDLDASRQRNDTPVAPRSSRNSLSPWQMPGTDHGLDRSSADQLLAPEAGYDIKADAYAPLNVNGPSRGTRRR